MKKILLLVSLFSMLFSTAQTQDSLFVWKAGVMIHKQSIKPADMDSITFKRPLVNLANVTICSQVWATRNLDVTTYSDGTPIPQVTDPTEWANLTTGAWCYYNNDPAYNPVYGKLYNWYAVAGIYDAASIANPSLRKKLAPTGWHVPTVGEWDTIINCLGGTSVAGAAMKETGTTHWIDNNTGAGATNSSGFTGLPGSYRFQDGTYSPGVGYVGIWWSSLDFSTVEGIVIVLSSCCDATGNGAPLKTTGNSVRCIKD